MSQLEGIFTTQHKKPGLHPGRPSSPRGLVSRVSDRGVFPSRRITRSKARAAPAADNPTPAGPSARAWGGLRQAGAGASRDCLIFSPKPPRATSLPEASFTADLRLQWERSPALSWVGGVRQPAGQDTKAAAQQVLGQKRPLPWDRRGGRRGRQSQRTKRCLAVPGSVRGAPSLSYRAPRGPLTRGNLPGKTLRRQA